MPTSSFFNWKTYRQPVHDTNRYVMLTHCINLFFVFVISIPLIVLIVTRSSHGVSSYGRFLLLIAWASANFLLLHFQRHFLAKVSTVIAPFACIIVFPVSSHFIHAGMFLWMPYGIMALGFIPFMIFSFESEKKTMVFFGLFYFITSIFFDEALMIFLKKELDLSFISKYYHCYFVPKVIIVSFLYTSLVVFKLVYFKNRRKLLLLQKELDFKNKELQSLNFLLKIKVEDKTKKLQIQNQKIKNLTFSNSHEFRAYLARIIGLLNLKKLTLSSQEVEFCECKIMENAMELKKLSRLFYEELMEGEQ